MRGRIPDAHVIVCLTVPAARPVQYVDRQGNPTHRVRLTVPHTELTILAVGNVRLVSPPYAIEEMEMNAFLRRRRG